MTIYKRPFVRTLIERLHEPKPLIQVLLGPRQVGKTTGVQQALALLKAKQLYVSADAILYPDSSWLLLQWQMAIQLGPGAILVIDEIQKIAHWAEAIKNLWDNQRTVPIKCILLGSSSLQLQKGLTESLTGRFELITVGHWGYHELKQAFGYTVERYLTYGGYPGAVPFEKNFNRWYAYIKDSIIETVIGKDILNFRQVHNPALFRQAFEILCQYPAQEISYTKLLGQLQDKGNTDLVKYYIELYAGAFLLTPLFKYSSKPLQVKSSSPKMLPLCPALYTVHQGPDVLKSSVNKGRLLELAVGARLHLLPGTLFYWREKNHEVDYVFCLQGQVYAIEVKSGRQKTARGLTVFLEKFTKSKPIIISPENFSLFDQDPLKFLQSL